MASAIGLLGVVGWILVCRPHESARDTVDDAYITFVYARNVAAGHGLRFNPMDAEPTEGFSSPAHVLLTAGAIYSGIEPLLFSRLLGLITFFSVPFALAWGLRSALGCSLNDAAWSATVCWSAFGLLPEMATHFGGGLETAFYVGLLGLWSAWSLGALSQERLGPHLLWIGGALGVAVVLARPEGIIVVAGTLGALAIARYMERAADWQKLLLLNGVIGVCFGAYLLWKLSYFGGVLPNPFYVKAHNAIYGTAGRVFPGLAFVAGFVQVRLLPLVLLTAAVASLIGIRRQRARDAVLLLGTPLATVFAYARAIHEVAVGFRFELPYLAAFVVCAAVVVGGLRQVAPRAGAWTFVLILYGVYLLGPVRPLQVLRWAESPARAALAGLSNEPDNAWSRMGWDLATTGLGQRGTILLSAAGQIPYFSRFYSIDVVGLNTTRLSGKYPLTLDEVWAYIEERRPDVLYSLYPPAQVSARSATEDPGFSSAVVQRMFSGAVGELMRQWDGARMREQVFREMKYIRDHYAFGAAYRTDRDWFIFAYVRRDSAHLDAILAALHSSTRADYSDLSERYVTDPRALGTSPRSPPP